MKNKLSIIIGILISVAINLCATAQVRFQPGSDPTILMRANARQRAEWAKEWLSSDDPRLVAWGAWLARHDQLKDLAPFLVTKLAEYLEAKRPPDEATDDQHHDASLVVLDALIGLDAVVPPRMAGKLFPEFAAQSLILLVRSREDTQPELLNIFQNAKANWNWLAAGNVLAKKRTPGFAAELLTGFTQHISVSVISEDLFGGFGGSAGGSECGNLASAPKASWPAVGQYFLMQFPERFPWLPAPAFLVGGETPVYYWRTEPGYQLYPADVPGACDDGNRDQYRVQYLNKWLEYSSSFKNPHLTVKWESDAAYRGRMLAAVEEQRSAFRSAVARLRDLGLLTPAEALSLKPRVEVVISDFRKKGAPPLPAVFENDESVAVRTAFGH